MNVAASKNILLKSNCIVIPKALRQKILEIPHNQQQGISKTKVWLQEKGLSADTEHFIKACYACQVTEPCTVQYEELKMSETLKTSWHTLKGRVSCGTNLTELIKYCSLYPVATSMKTIKNVNIIKSLEKTFSLFSYPAKITTDNGPKFKPSEFKTHLSTYNKEHHIVTLSWPIANGEVEMFNRTLGKAIKCAHIDRKSWKEKLDKFLQNYLSIPHSITQSLTYPTLSFHTDSKLTSQHSKRSNRKTITKHLID